MNKIVSRRLIIVLIILGFTSFTFVNSLAALGHGHGTGHVKKQLRGYFEGLTAQGLFTGAVLVAKNGKILLKRGFGIADYDTGKPNTPKTVYSIASMTKAFTAMSIMMLEERGLLSVNDRLSDYFPDYPRGDDITIHQMLNMTAGIHGFFDDEALWANISTYHEPEDMLQYFIDDPLDFEPGTQWAYCNSCYVLLGIIIEKVSGMTYRDFIKENILCPLRMRHTSYDPEGMDFLNRKAVGYDTIATLPPPISFYLHPTIAYSAGGIFSTVTDMYKWAKSLETDMLVTNETLERIVTPGLGNYGYGWYIENHEVAGLSRKMIWHWGSYVGYHGFIARFVDDDLFIIMLLNISAPNDVPYQLLPFVKGAAEIALSY
jgi:CubicO group peptidase (beta-lactamase class C family)